MQSHLNSELEYDYNMKHLVFTLLVFVLFSCDNEAGWGCIQTSGPSVVDELTVEPFDKILVNRDIELVIRQGEAYNVEIQTGQNLRSGIEVSVVENQLQLTDHNSCNFVRDYGLTKISVTTPTLKEIRSSTQYLTSSDGALNFENLTLLCENYNSDYLSIGDFKMTVNTQTLRVVANNLSEFTIEGSVEHLIIGFYAGLCQFNGAELSAQNVTVFQRSSHDITVKPLQSLEGEIRSVGNVISIHTPPIVDVQEYYSGRLVFLD
jgi:hypothetical protein